MVTKRNNDSARLYRYKTRAYRPERRTCGAWLQGVRTVARLGPGEYTLRRGVRHVFPRSIQPELRRWDSEAFQLDDARVYSKKRRVLRVGCERAGLLPDASSQILCPNQTGRAANPAIASAGANGCDDDRATESRIGSGHRAYHTRH